MRRLNLLGFTLLFVSAALSIVSASCSEAVPSSLNGNKFTALPIFSGGFKCSRMLYRYGIPFMETPWHPPTDGSFQAKLREPAREIFLLRMKETERPQAWSDAASYANRGVYSTQRGFLVGTIHGARRPFAGLRTFSGPGLLKEG